MNIRSAVFATGLMLALSLCAVTSFAAEDFRASIKAGEAASAAIDYDTALAEFDEALIQSKSNTDRGIALSKKAHVLAYNLKDFTPALELAEKALKLDGAHAVAQVMAMRVKAHCLMSVERDKPRAERDFAPALATLVEARSLEGVEWAQPNLALMLGDCHRFAGQFEEALAVFAAIPEMDSANDKVKAVAHLNRGLTYQYSLKQPAEAREAYGQALALNPGLQGEIDNHFAKLPGEPS